MIKRIRILRFISFVVMAAFAASLLGAIAIILTRSNALKSPVDPGTLWLLIGVLVCGTIIFALFLAATSSNLLEKYFSERTLNERISKIDQQSEELKNEENRDTHTRLKWDNFKTEVYDIHVRENLDALNEQTLVWISKGFELVTGLVFLRQAETDMFNLSAKYAWYGQKDPENFRLGETLPGQAAKDQRMLDIQNVPKEYIEVVSGLGKGSPKHLLIFPMVHEGNTVGLIELASFAGFDENFKGGLAGVASLLAPEYFKNYTAK